MSHAPIPRSRTRPSAWALAPLLASAMLSAEAEILVEVHAEFPTSGFAQGPVFGGLGPEIFDVVFHLDETAASFYPAGFEVAPGQFELAHDVYAFDRNAILGSSFSFGSQGFTEPYLHNLSFALLQNGVIAAPMFLSDITPGSTPFIEVGTLGPFLGGYDFGPFVPGQPRPVFLTNGAEAFDGVHAAFGTVAVRVSAVPLPASLPALLSGGVALVAFARRARPAAAPG